MTQTTEAGLVASLVLMRHMIPLLSEKTLMDLLQVNYTIGFTLLYFKMAVIPLVPETKMVDVGKLISLENLLVRKIT